MAYTSTHSKGANSSAMTDSALACTHRSCTFPFAESSSKCRIRSSSIRVTFVFGCSAFLFSDRVLLMVSLWKNEQVNQNRLVGSLLDQKEYVHFAGK